MPEEEALSPPPRAPWPRRLGRLLRDIVVAGVALLLLSTVLGRLRAPDLPPAAPAFALPTLAGDQVSLAQFSGQTVVLNFWASWCGPCRAEIPMLNAFAADHPEVPLLGIAIDRDPRAARAAAQDWGIDYPVLVGGPAMAKLYDATTVPTTVVVGPGGEVKGAHVGIITNPQLWWMTR